MNAPLVSGSQNPQEVEDSRIAKLREARRAARAARESFQIDDNGGENGERRPSTSNTGVALQNASQVQYQQRGGPTGRSSQNPGPQRKPVLTTIPPVPQPFSSKSLPPHPTQAAELPTIDVARLRQLSLNPATHHSSPSTASNSPTHSEHAQASRQHHHNSLPTPPKRPPPPQEGPNTIINPGSGELNRISSPSVSQSVLQPLEKKLQEYDHLMSEAHSTMIGIDEELRVLQERRREQEDRYKDARAKRDEYQRQWKDVERALRGGWEEEDPGRGQRMERVQTQTQTQPQVRRASTQRLENLVEAGREDSVRSGEEKGRLRTRDRFRMTIFGRD